MLSTKFKPGKVVSFIKTPKSNAANGFFFYSFRPILTYRRTKGPAQRSAGPLLSANPSTWFFP